MDPSCGCEHRWDIFNPRSKGSLLLHPNPFLAMAFSVSFSYLSVARPCTSCGSLSQVGGRTQAPPAATVSTRVNDGQFAGSRCGATFLSRPQRSATRLRAEGGLGALSGVEEWGEPVSLGTATLPEDVNVVKLGDLLFQWGNSLTQNANLPLPLPLKVDRVQGGVRLGYIRLANGAVEDLLHIDVTVSPGVGGGKPTFQAVRSGRHKTTVPPGEDTIMQSLLQALRKAVQLARN